MLVHLRSKKLRKPIWGITSGTSDASSPKSRNQMGMGIMGIPRTCSSPSLPMASQSQCLTSQPSALVPKAKSQYWPVVVSCCYGNSEVLSL